MAVSGDITVAQDGGQSNVKLHPYLVTLVRWCVSCLWRTAGVLLHRLMTTSLQPITGQKPPVPKPKVPKRKAGTEHLHPEPRVECQLLHQPEHHTLDVIFVHGLYGSLGNTWRQGDWRLKYQVDPQKVPLRNHSKPNSCNCQQISYKNLIYNENKCDDNIMDLNSTITDLNDPITDLNDPEMSLKKINEKLSKKVIPEENDLITEQFYNNTLRDQVDIIDNYDTQAKFVSDLFKKENDSDENQYNKNQTNNDFKCNPGNDNGFICDYNEVNECKCEKKCEVGCGCVCNECYSNCWPKDWVKMDFPGARVISINYTSDPYLWRPLWIKENKRLNLYERAEQMIDQLLEMRVGEKPIIWVGHSKGGLFIKQIYCEAYKAYMKNNKNYSTQDENKDRLKAKRKEEVSNETHNGITAENIDTIIGHFSHDNDDKTMRKNDNHKNNSVKCTENNIHTKNTENYTRNGDNCTGNNNHTKNSENCIENHCYMRNSDNNTRNGDNYTENNNCTSNSENYMSNGDHCTENYSHMRNSENYMTNGDNSTGKNNYMSNSENYTKNSDNCTENNNHTRNSNNYTENNYCIRNNDNDKRNNDNIANNNACVMNETVAYENVFEHINFTKNGRANDNNLNYIKKNSLRNLRDENFNGKYVKMLEIDIENGDGSDMTTTSIEEDASVRRSLLWSSSRAFMFYSVPHRGSPLADIKTPVTARSVDLLEIAKDCPLVLELQSRWEAASGAGAARAPLAVRSLVETSRTLMSVLWLRIVSAESADAGIGSLSGISVDHREICKPSSRSCLLYTELTELIHEALSCRCQ